MAEIKMDVSEYELLKENKRLYEESLKKERELNLEIKRLTDEKLKALEDAKMKVIKVNKTEITEHLLVKKNYREMISNLLTFVKHYDGVKLHHTIGYDVYEEQVNHFIDSCFTKHKSVSYPPVAEITTCGLDEIKQELRENIQAHIDEDIKEKLKDYDEFNKMLKQLEDRNNELSSELSILGSNYDNLETAFDKKVEDLHRCKKQHEKLEEIRATLQDGYTRWNRGKLLDKIIEILK